MERLQRTLLLVAAFLLIVALPAYTQERVCEREGKGGECTKPEGEECTRKCKAPTAEKLEGRGWIGVELRPVADATRAHLDLPEGKGVEIARVIPDSPASQAGLQVGDIIMAIDGKEIAGVGDLRRIMAEKKAGQVVVLGIIRKRKNIDVSVTLGRLPELAGLTVGPTPGKEGKTPTFEKPPVDRPKPTVRTAEQIREQAKNLLDKMRERRPREKGKPPENITDLMDRMFGEEPAKPEDEATAEDDAEEESPFGGDLGDLLRGLFGEEEGEEGDLLDLGKLFEHARKWMQSEEGQRMMRIIGEMFGGRQEGGEDEQQSGLDLTNIQELVEQFMGGKQEPESEEEVAEGEEGGEEEEPAPQPTIDQLRELVRTLQDRLSKLEKAHHEIAKMRETLESQFRRLVDSTKQEIEKTMGEMLNEHQKQMIEMLKNRLQDFVANEESAGALKRHLEKVRQHVKKQVDSLKQELDRQRDINEWLKFRIKKLKDHIRRLREREPAPETTTKPAEHVTTLEAAPETAGEPGGSVLVLESAPELVRKPTKPVEPKKPAVTEARPWLGIVPGDVDEATRDALGLPEKGGCLIEKIVPGSPAEKAGLQADDFILTFKGEQVKSAEHLRDLVSQQKVGTTVEIDFIRDGVHDTIKVTLGAVSKPATEKKDAAKRNLHKVTKPKPHARTKPLEKIENILQMLCQLSGGRKLFITIQDEKGNTYVRHELDPEKLLKTFRKYIAPLLDLLGRPRGEGEERCPLRICRPPGRRLERGRTFRRGDEPCPKPELETPSDPCRRIRERGKCPCRRRAGRTFMPPRGPQQRCPAWWCPQIFMKVTERRKDGVTTRTLRPCGKDDICIPGGVHVGTFDTPKGVEGGVHVEAFVDPEVEAFMEWVDEMPFPEKTKICVELLDTTPDGGACKFHHGGDCGWMFEEERESEPCKPCRPGIKIIEKFVEPFLGEELEFEFQIGPDSGEEDFLPKRPKASRRERRCC